MDMENLRDYRFECNRDNGFVSPKLLTYFTAKESACSKYNNSLNRKRNSISLVILKRASFEKFKCLEGVGFDPN